MVGSPRAGSASNLKQIGIARRAYHGANRKLPRYRRCPDLTNTADPTTSQKPDIDCNSLTSATTYTGPNEEWWAPYDNRPARNDGTRGHHWGYRGFLGSQADLEKRPSGRYRTRTYDP